MDIAERTVALAFVIITSRAKQVKYFTRNYPRVDVFTDHYDLKLINLLTFLSLTI